MAEASALPAELRFLEDMLGNRGRDYKAASWRSNPFEANVWNCDYGLEIDFRVKLDDGTLLTESRHSRLLETFKSWLCVQSHGDCTGGVPLDAESTRQRIRYTLRLIDYFLINAKRFQLATYGLENITENDLRGLLIQLSQSSSVAISIYRWPQRLEEFLRARIDTLDEKELSSILVAHPMVHSDIPPLVERMLNLSDSEILRARAWLWDAEFYRECSKGNYRYNPNTALLAKTIYADTVGGKKKKSIPSELLLDPSPRYHREYPAVAVKGAVEGPMTDKSLANYAAVLRRLGLLAQIGLPVPTAALSAISTADVLRALNLKSISRYRNLPHALVNDSLRHSIEFALAYGEDIVASFLNLVRESKVSQVECRGFSKGKDIRTFLTPRLLELGVTHWTVQDVPKASQCISESRNAHPNFELFRSNKGLWELLRVLYGAVQICVGTLMARRQGELTDLIAGKCLDATQTRLVFLNRKSGVAGLRQKEARPIPKIAVKLINLIHELQAGLISIGVLATHKSLFAYPGLSIGGLVALHANQYNESLDYFCDYFETPIKNGERYYIRQHQLRRFVAMLFFWGRSFGGLDTLRWYLGHTDVKHLYHYITESTPGDVLRSIKACYAADQIRALADDAEALAALLEGHFGTRFFSVLDSDELTEYIEELIDDGRVEIEPEFLESPEGGVYRVLIVVTPKGRLI